MCFFRKYKLINPKLNIETKEIVIKQKLRRKGIKFGTKLVVPRNFVFLTVKNGKVLDAIEFGDYQITTKLLKETTLKLKLYKSKKPPKFAPVDAFFVNCHDFENIAWQAGKISLEDKKYGAYKCSISGTINFNVVDPSKLLKFLLTEVIEITNDNATTTILNEVNNLMYKHIYNKNYNAEKLYFKDDDIVNELYITLNEQLNNYGINVSGLSITNVEFPNKMLKLLEKLTPPPKTNNKLGTSVFEDWQKNNPTPQKKGTQFVTIEPEKKGKKNFFKESMAPYFFAEDEEENIEPIRPKTKWLGPIEKEKLENSKKFVDLDDN